MMIKEIKQNGKILSAELLSGLEICPTRFAVEPAIEDYATKEELEKQVAELTKEVRVLWECVKVLSSRVDI